MKSSVDFPTRTGEYNRKSSHMSMNLQSGEEKASALKNQTSTIRPGAFFIPKQRGKIDFVALVRGEQIEDDKYDHKACGSNLDGGIIEFRMRLKTKALILSTTSSRSRTELSSAPVLDWNEQLYDLSNLCLRSQDNEEETNAPCCHRSRVARQIYSRPDKRSGRWMADCPTLYPLKESISVLRIQRSPPLCSEGSGVDASETMSRKQQKRHQNQIKNHSFLLEISPGVSVTLRGSIETRKALRKGNVTSVQCMECNTESYCIDDAKYILCPLCRCISPNLNRSRMTALYGVGLGFQDYSERDLLDDTDEDSSLSTESDSD